MSRPVTPVGFDGEEKEGGEVVHRVQSRRGSTTTSAAQGATPVPGALGAPGAARDSIEAAEAFRQEFGKVQRDFRASLELQGKLLAKVRAKSCSAMEDVMSGEGR